MKRNRIIKLLFLLAISYYIQSKQESKAVSRNPFCFPNEPKQEQKKAISQQPILPEPEQVQLVKTETKWHVKTVLPGSVIMQHKEDGQIREIALTGTNLCS